MSEYEVRSNSPVERDHAKGITPVFEGKERNQDLCKMSEFPSPLPPNTHTYTRI